MKRVAGNTPFGRSRRSLSLGDTDPRRHRDPQAAAAPELTFDHPIIVVRETGRISLAPCPAVEDETTTVATAAKNQTKLNEILAALRAGGIMET